MSNPLNFHPPGLTRSQTDRLSTCADLAAKMDIDSLQAAAQQHLEETRTAHQTNRMVNVRLAEAIVLRIGQAVDGWDALQESRRYWLAGAVYYFSLSDDDEPDFSSPIGFEDDAEILNACLRFAGQEDLCLNIEEYDDV